MRARWLFLLAAGVVAADGQSSPRPLQFDVVYSCSSGRTRLKVTSCAGAADSDSCDIQYLDATAAQGLGARISAPRQQVTQLLQTCSIERPPAKVESAPAPPPAPRREVPPAQNQRQSPPPPVASAPAARPGASPQQMSSNGISVGDTVDILTGFGWISGKVLAVNGNNYRVHGQTGIDVWKTYPAEVRRTGAPNGQDRANGIYQLHDKVQVNFQGQWVNSEVVATMGMEYQVTLPGNRTVWAGPQNLRYAGPAAAAPRAAAAPAKSNRTPCGAKLEGRWGNSQTTLSIEFRSGKAHVTAAFGSNDMMDCFVSGDSIFLVNGGKEEYELKINDDGTLDAPFGELKRKGK